MTERELMLAGRLYNLYKVGVNTWETIRATCKKFNESEFWHDTRAFEELKNNFGRAGNPMVLTPPFYCDYGDRIHFGDHFYANTGLTILDENEVVFGDYVFLGPNVNIYTASHPICAEVRNLELETAETVRIGNSVWIGAML